MSSIALETLADFLKNHPSALTVHETAIAYQLAHAANNDGHVAPTPAKQFLAHVPVAADRLFFSTLKALTAYKLIEVERTPGTASGYQWLDPQIADTSQHDELVARIAALNPPPKSATEAVERLRVRRARGLAAYRQWQELGRPALNELDTPQGRPSRDETLAALDILARLLAA